MEIYERHRRVWRGLYPLLRPWICGKFGMEHEDLHISGPFLLVSNHVTAWDPLLVAMSLPKNQMYYVASEHLFRLGFVTKLLEYLVAPIPRRKGTTGSDTAKACLRHLKAGRSVGLFAEGEQCWDGKTCPVFPATGKLARLSGASLVTYRLEGGYLSKPRWGKGVRKGRVLGHPVHVYSPEQLKAMTPAQIDAAIQRDISEDAWERQRKDPVQYHGRTPAEGMERALFLCPGCGRIGTLKTKKDRVFCDCGLDLRYTDTGFFSPDSPFEDLAQWDAWQHAKLRERDFPHKERLFADDHMLLTRVAQGHREEVMGRGALEQYEDRLVCAGHDFPMAEIGNMAVVVTNRLVFSFRDEYWQIKAEKGGNLRKYLAIWKER